MFFYKTNSARINHIRAFIFLLSPILFIFSLSVMENEKKRPFEIAIYSFILKGWDVYKRQVLRRERDRLETAVVAFHNPDVVCCLRPDRHSLLSAKMSACESLLSPNNGNFRPKHQILSDHRSIVACKIRAHTGKYPFYTMSVLFLFSTPLP